MVCISVARATRPRPTRSSSRPCVFLTRCLFSNANHAFFQCGACQLQFYCSVDCQRAHWKKSHKQQCAKLAEQRKQPTDQLVLKLAPAAAATAAAAAAPSGSYRVFTRAVPDAPREKAPVEYRTCRCFIDKRAPAADESCSCPGYFHPDADSAPKTRSWSACACCGKRETAGAGFIQVPTAAAASCVVDLLSSLPSACFAQCNACLSAIYCSESCEKTHAILHRVALTSAL